MVESRGGGVGSEGWEGSGDTSFEGEKPVALRLFAVSLMVKCVNEDFILFVDRLFSWALFTLYHD